ncbi:MAG TPA: raffinose synthase, partial [Phycisphaerae bacterium]|nr:raffinose synthase [Phycisphaerae bacterium]
DKYLSPAAVEAVRQTPSQLTFRLAESGPFAVWIAEGTPSADGLEFRDAGGGLWHARMPVGKRNVDVTVTRK